MDDDDTGGYVLVYRYRFWNPATNAMEISQEMATLDAIRDGLGAAMTDTGIKVLRNQLDSRGRYGATASPRRSRFEKGTLR